MDKVQKQATVTVTTVFRRVNEIHHMGELYISDVYSGPYFKIKLFLVSTVHIFYYI